MRLTELGDHLAALDLQRDLAIGERPFVQVRLAREGLPHGFREEVDRIAESFPVRIQHVNSRFVRRRIWRTGRPSSPPQRRS